MSKAGHEYCRNDKSAHSSNLAKSRVSLTLLCGGTGSNSLQHMLSLLDRKSSRKQPSQIILIDSQPKTIFHRRIANSCAVHVRAFLKCGILRLLPSNKFNKKMEASFAEKIRNDIFPFLSRIPSCMDKITFTHVKQSVIGGLKTSRNHCKLLAGLKTARTHPGYTPFFTICKGLFFRNQQLAVCSAVRKSRFPLHAYHTP